jgi:hypothetical protein
MSAYYKIDFTASTNADLRQAFAARDANDAPINLNGAELKMDIEDASNNDVLEISSSNGRINITDATAGEFELIIPAADMGTLSAGVYNHDLILTLANNHIHRIWKGTLDLHRGVTE